MQGSWKKQKSNEAEKQKKNKEAEKQSKARNQESKKKNTQTGKYPQINNPPIYIYISGWWFEPLWKILVNWDD